MVKTKKISNYSESRVPKNQGKPAEFNKFLKRLRRKKQQTDTQSSTPKLSKPKGKPESYGRKLKRAHSILLEVDASQPKVKRHSQSIHITCWSEPNIKASIIRGCLLEITFDPNTLSDENVLNNLISLITQYNKYANTFNKQRKNKNEEEKLTDGALKGVLLDVFDCQEQNMQIIIDTLKEQSLNQDKTIKIAIPVKSPADITNIKSNSLIEYINTLHMVNCELLRDLNDFTRKKQKSSTRAKYFYLLPQQEQSMELDLTSRTPCAALKTLQDL